MFRSWLLKNGWGLAAGLLLVLKRESSKLMKQRCPVETEGTFPQKVPGLLRFVKPPSRPKEAKKTSGDTGALE